MQDPTDWGDPGVYSPQARVIVDTPREVANNLTQWSVNREITTNLPEQVRVGAGESVASASVSWENSQPLSGNAKFSGRESRLEVRRQPLESWLQLFQGRVWDASSSVSAGGVSAVSLECDDPVSDMRGTVTIPAVVRELPPYEFFEDGSIHRVAEVNRFISMCSTWVIDHIGRQLGFRCTPPIDDNCLINATMLGSSWPEIGRLRYSRFKLGLGSYPEWVITPWGAGMRRGYVSFQWFPVQEPGSGSPTIRSSVWRAQFMAHCAASNGEARVTLRSKDNTPFSGIQIRVRRDSSGVYFGAVEFSEGSVLNTASVPVDISDQRFIATIHPVPGEDKLRVNLSFESQDAWVELPISDPQVIDTNIWEYLAEGDFIPIGGVQLSQDSSRPAVTSWPANANYSYGETMTAIPSIKGAKAWDVLKEIVAAESGGLWISETGVLTFFDRAKLGQGVTSSATEPLEISARQTGLSGIDITESLSEVYQRVEMPLSRLTATWALPSTGDPTGSNGVDVWALDETVAVAPGALFERIIEIERIPFSIRPFDYPLYGNEPTLSVYYLSSTGDEYNAITTGVTGGERGAEMVSINTLRVWLRNETANTVYIRGEDNPDGGVYPGFVVRAGAVTYAQDSTVITSPPGKPKPTDRTLSMPANPWRQRELETQGYADWLKGEVAAPKPSIRNVELVRPDPRIQLGDRRRLKDPDKTGADLDVVVIGSSLSGQAGQLSQSLTVRPRPVTWGEMDEYLDWADIEQLGYQGWQNWRP